MSNIVIKDSNKFKDVITNFQKSVNNIDNIFSNINENINNITEEDAWQGELKEATCNKYNELSANYETIIESLNKLSTFMENTLNSYINAENTTDSDIDNNSTNLDVNS